MRTAKISGTGKYLPKTVVTNDELAKRVETSDEWIQQRVGIKARHIADETETNVFMATYAAREALEKAALSPDQIDLIIVATSTPDDLMPNTAGSVQAKLGINFCIAFDVNAACAGFIYALTIAHQFFQAGTVKHALIIGSERMSRVINWEDRTTCVLFGDGAGAVALSASDKPGILYTKSHSTGQHRDYLFVPNAIPKQAFCTSTISPYLEMTGNTVFRYAVQMLGDVVEETLQHLEMTKADIDWLIPHQANVRIIAATAKKLGMDMSQVILTLPEHGNTSAASVPLALAVGLEQGKIKAGDMCLLEAFGAGFLWGACLVKI